MSRVGVKTGATLRNTPWFSAPAGVPSSHPPRRVAPVEIFLGRKANAATVAAVVAVIGAVVRLALALDRRPAPPLSLRQVDPLIRELTHYRDLIDRRTGDPS